jgi:hypothetical protein
VGEMKNVYSILVGKLEEKRLLVRPRSRWEDNIGTYLGEIELKGDFIRLAQGKDLSLAVVNTVMNLRVIKGRKFH